MPKGGNNIIDKLNSVDLSEICQTDEYCREIKQIQNYICENDDMSMEELAKEIDKIFNKSFK